MLYFCTFQTKLLSHNYLQLKLLITTIGNSINDPIKLQTDKASIKAFIEFLNSLKYIKIQSNTELAKIKNKNI
ncbi:hypothetical protein BpHYR1_038994 [Brachionus plicatilis]|uniref:Uncharacterized protein n=1 Tax=Brachionus plicatilis TaxID=10195 RepID=A0A3M7R811_BRAPC|nr:hypothetical protein BpHYR1_038994 [Brachionus plicatilis]